ncbi:MAG TPA: RNase adapter RapZ, partial [Geobacterales bacterium]|nr:RNase adapter RapZ [Geobacterales bacterium]
MRMVIITGHSGSGKSTAVKALEDEGFYCIDNLPVDLFTTFVELVEKSREHVTGIALVMDIRGRDFIKGYERIVQELGSSHPMEVIFLDASDEVLTR